MKIKQVVLKAFRWEMEGLLWVCLASWEGLQHIAERSLSAEPAACGELRAAPAGPEGRRRCFQGRDQKADGHGRCADAASPQTAARLPAEPAVLLDSTQEPDV